LIFVENPQDWSVDDVYYWAIGKVGVDEESASVLKSQNVNGKALWALTEEKLIKSPYNMSGGPATQLALAIENLKSKLLKMFIFPSYQRILNEQQQF
jgi:hypothetical protein